MDKHYVFRDESVLNLVALANAAIMDNPPREIDFYVDRRGTEAVLWLILRKSVIKRHFLDVDTQPDAVDYKNVGNRDMLVDARGITYFFGEWW